MYKILTIGNFGRGWDGSVCDELHISDALEELGHKVTKIQREDVGEKTVLPIHQDFTLIAQWNGYPKDLVKWLKGNNCDPIIYWAFDYQFMNKEQWHLDLAKEADLFLSHELEHRKFYEDLGAKFQWFCQDFSPSFIQPTTEEPKYDVVFTGSCLPWAEERNKTLKAIDKKFDLHIFGITSDQWKEQGFKNVHGPAMDEELPKIIGKVNIAIDHTLSEGYWSDRIAQYMCAGGFVLARYVSPQEMIFGSYPEYFYSVKDCLEKIQGWLDDDLTRKEWAKKGYEFADKNLRVKNRVQELITIYENKFI